MTRPAASSSIRGLEPPVTVQDFASFVGISPAKAYGMIRAGEIEAIHIGRSVRITPAAIRRFLGEDSASAASDHLERK